MAPALPHLRQVNCIISLVYIVFSQTTTFGARRFICHELSWLAISILISPFVTNRRGGSQHQAYTPRYGLSCSMCIPGKPFTGGAGITVGAVTATLTLPACLFTAFSNRFTFTNR